MTGLLHKLINLDRGVVTDSMVPFLLNERFPSALMAFVHRCDDEAAADDTGEGGSDGPSTSGGAENLLRPVDDYRHPRDEDHVKTLQSYKVGVDKCRARMRMFPVVIEQPEPLKRRVGFNFHSGLTSLRPPFASDVP